MKTKKELHFKTIHFDNSNLLILKTQPSRPTTNNHRYSEYNIKQKLYTEPKKQKITLHQFIKQNPISNVFQNFKNVEINGLNFEGYINSKSVRKGLQLQNRYRQTMKADFKPKITGGFNFLINQFLPKCPKQEQDLANFYNKILKLTKKVQNNTQIIQRYEQKQRIISECQARVQSRGQLRGTAIESQSKLVKKSKQRRVRPVSVDLVGRKSNVLKKRQNTKVGGYMIAPWQISEGEQGNMLLNFQ